MLKAKPKLPSTAPALLSWNLVLSYVAFPCFDVREQLLLSLSSEKHMSGNIDTMKAIAALAVERHMNEQLFASSTTEESKNLLQQLLLRNAEEMNPLVLAYRAQLDRAASCFTRLSFDIFTMAGCTTQTPDAYSIFLVGCLVECFFFFQFPALGVHGNALWDACKLGAASLALAPLPWHVKCVMLTFIVIASLVIVFAKK